MQTDERNGKPSASGIERLSLCPGSFNLEKTLPPLPESEDAASGTRIHAAYAGADVELSEQEDQTFRLVRQLEEQTIEKVLSDEAPLLTIRERRYWFNERCSGQPDFVAITAGEALILDAKSGRGEVTKAEGNPQLRTLAVLVDEHHAKYQFDRIVVGIIQPWSAEKVSLCEYNRADLTKARKWLVDVLDAAEKPDAPRIPGEKQCQWCRAKAVCPEAQTLAVGQSLIVSKLQGIKEPESLALSMTPSALGFFLDSAAFATSVIEACRDEAKRRLSAGEEVPGWRLKEGATREVITDPEAVFTRFCERGGNSGAFMPAVTLNKAKLKDALKKVTGEKGKGLDAELDTLLAGLTESKQNAPSLERVKE